MDWTEVFASRIGVLKPSAIRAMAKHVGQPGVISFASGEPDAALFPVEQIAESIAEILADPALAREALQYGPSEGYLPLRRLIGETLSHGDAVVPAEDVVVTSGSQQALDFVGKTFIDRGDRIVVTRPTYSGALQAFGLYEPAFAEVGVQDGALDLQALEAEFAGAPKFFYVMPDHGNPSGATIPLAQRHAVLELAGRYGVPVIEDQAYDQLQLSGESLPTLLSLDRARAANGDSIVLHLGTFSKSLTPGLRVGWIVASTAVHQRLVSIKQASDLNSGMLNQMAVERVARRIMSDHGPVLRERYRARRDVMLAALGAHMPEGVEWGRPNGGMFVWLTLPDELDAAALQDEAFRAAKVIFVPGAAFHANGTGGNTLRLSYSLMEEAAIAEGVRRLAGVIARMIG